jgi:hypothetical protein
MPVSIKPTSVIKARLGLEPNGKVHAFFTATCAKHNDPYVPFRNGTLAGTVIQGGEPTANVKTDRYIYEQPYARYVYYGLSKSGKPLHYSTDKHSKASSYWDKRMWSVEKDTIIKEVQDYVNRGGK